MKTVVGVAQFLWEVVTYVISTFLSWFIPERTYQEHEKPTVAVIGSGFSGMCAAIQVKKKFGIKAQIFDASPEIGGTWEANTYPGCACDIPSHLYSYSFELNPNWSRSYSPQKEILNYLRGVATKYGLYDQTLLSTEVIKATWLEGQQKWKLDYRNKATPDKIKTAFFDVVFAGIGPLRIPKIPDQFSGFKGTIVHTAYWNNKIDFKDKKVAIIGSGASAVQTLPELQKVAAKIISYQRNPAWVVARAQIDYSTLRKTLYSTFPFLCRLQRWLLFTLQEIRLPMIFKESFLARKVRKQVVQEMTHRLEKQGRPDLVEALIPKYALGCKRICVSEIYLEALAKKNVEVKTGQIKQVKENSILHEDGTEQQIDVLVLATGFDVQGFLGNLEIRGRKGLLLNDLWSKEYPSTLQNVNIHGFPNFFILLGPNSALGHNSVVVMAEIQVEYAMRSIKYMIQNKLAALEAKKEAAEAYAMEIRNQLKDTPWTTSCTSFYKNDRGEPYTLWAGTVTYFWYKMRHANYLRDFIHYAKH